MTARIGYLSLSLLPGEAGIRQTVDVMRRLTNAAIRDPLVRWQADRILQAAHVPPNNDYKAAQEILRWITTATVYRRDPQIGPEEQERIEWPPWVIRQVASGITPGLDCDDWTVLSLALAGSIGIPGRIHVVSTLPSKAYNHVYGQLKIQGEWMDIDATRFAVGRLTGRFPAAKPMTAFFDVGLQERGGDRMTLGQPWAVDYHPERSAGPDRLPYDASLRVNPGAALQVNRGCPLGYAAVFTAHGPICRLLATSTVDTAQQESALTWGETAQIFTSAASDTARQVETVVAAVPTVLTAWGQGVLWVTGGLAVLFALAWLRGGRR